MSNGTGRTGFISVKNPLRTALPTLKGDLKRPRTAMLLAGIVALPLAAVTLTWPLAIALGLVVVLAWQKGYQSRWVRWGAVAGCFAVLWIYRPDNQQDFFSAAVLALVATKMLELKTLRDGQFLLNTSLFSLFAAALLTPSAWMSALVVSGTAALLLGQYLLLNPDDQLSWKRLWRLLKRTGVVVLAVAPIMVGLFYAFPRFGGNFFSLGLMSGATAGLTDRLEPGSLADLALSDEVRFRVESDNPATNLYFRVYVLEEFDGTSWIQSDQSKPEPATGLIGDRNVTIEMPADGQTWYPLPEWPSSQYLNGPAGTLVPDDPVEQLWSQQFLVSASPIRKQTLSDLDEFRLTEMDQENPRTQAWIEPLQDASLNEVTSFLTDYFQRQIYYSLTPPAAPDFAPVDALLFDSKTGFCGHYANAVTYVYRSLGWPARVVTGFQGGRYNAVGQYIQVRDADAHAWLEVHDGEQWIRIDPTAWVAPERVQRGIDILGDAVNLSTGVSRDTFDAGVAGEIARTFWDQVRDGLDYVQRGYTRWVVDFNQERQQSLFSGLKQQWPWLGLLLIWPLWQFIQTYRRQDPWLRRFDRWARRRGMKRSPHQLPSQVSSDPSVREFCLAWQAWKYGNGSENQLAASLNTLRKA